MYTVVTVLIIISCILLILVVLVQNSKGGGLASGFAGSNQLMGVKKTTDFIEKLTWGLALALVVFCLIGSFSLPNKEARISGSALQEHVENAGDAPQKAPVNVPAQPQQPAQDQQSQPAQPDQQKK